MLAVGDKVVYPRQGPCLISAITERVVDDKSLTFYRLLVLDDSRGELLVPVDKLHSIGIRPLLRKPDVARLFDRLKKPSIAAVDRKQRARDNLRLLASGSAFDLADIVESLTELIETKELSTGERATLDRAKRLLVCEISEVTGEAREEAEQSVDRALVMRKKAKRALPNRQDDAVKTRNPRNPSMPSTA